MHGIQCYPQGTDSRAPGSGKAPTMQTTDTHAADWEAFCADQQFMQPEIARCAFFYVETEQGGNIVLADLIRPAMAIDYRAGGTFDPETPGFEGLARQLEPFVEGTEIQSTEPRFGFLARLSAPGYLDCTDWSAHDTRRDAEAHLMDMYGE